ncbi:MAG TPA: outer membrane beta-barrel protein [Alphaproteobacteria bacterium]|nr:outer membrane beta-barrel protein [Alphaproteobacteria bacterium]
MKKILLAAAAIITATAAQAESASFSGFYAGVHGGVSQLNGQSTKTQTGSSDQRDDFGKAGAVFGFHAGYGMMLSSNVYGALEAYLGFNSAKIEVNKTDTGKGEIKKKNFYGLAARFGYLFNSSTMLYGRLALEAGKIEAKSISNGTDILKLSKNNIRPVIGGGIETALSNNVLLGVEYNYVVGSKLSKETKVGAVTDGLKLNTSEHRTLVRLSYKF